MQEEDFFFKHENAIHILINGAHIFDIWRLFCNYEWCSLRLEFCMFPHVQCAPHEFLSNCTLYIQWARLYIIYHKWNLRWGIAKLAKDLLCLCIIIFLGQWKRNTACYQCTQKKFTKLKKTTNRLFSWSVEMYLYDLKVFIF